MDPDDIFHDKRIQEEDLVSIVQRQYMEIKKLEKANEELRGEMNELDHLMKQYAAQM